MKAIYSRELNSYYHNMTAYIFAAALLILVGLAAMVYNINGAIANFEYVLASISLGFVIIIPLLTMRSITEERRQKTDQLLYSLPISLSKIVIGKFLALLTVFAFPLVVVAAYPLVFKQYGDVYLRTSYGSLFAFFLMGAAWIAVGMFISSLTEKLAASAGFTAVIILANYYCCNVADSMTGNVGEFLSKVFEKISLFERFYVFVNGIFDITGIIFFLTVTALFIFLTIQSMEKRRYS